MRIFIVEDEALIAMELEERIKDLGHEVCGHALRGEDALALIPLHRPDLVLLDVNLGRGMSGLAVAERLQALDLRIVFLTAYTSAELEERAGGRPLHYLVKPFRSQELRSVIDRVSAEENEREPS